MKIVILVRVLLSMIHKLSKCNKTKRSLSIWYIKKRAKRGWKAKFWKERKEILTLIMKFLNKIAWKVKKLKKRKKKENLNYFRLLRTNKALILGGKCTMQAKENDYPIRFINSLIFMFIKERYLHNLFR